jgi:hypothetical protein
MRAGQPHTASRAGSGGGSLASSVVQPVTPLHTLQRLVSGEPCADLGFAALVHLNHFRIPGGGRAAPSGRAQRTLAGIQIFLDAQSPGAAQRSGKNVCAGHTKTHVRRSVASPRAGHGKKDVRLFGNEGSLRPPTRKSAAPMCEPSSAPSRLRAMRRKSDAVTVLLLCGSHFCIAGAL